METQTENEIIFDAILILAPIAIDELQRDFVSNARPVWAEYQLTKANEKNLNRKAYSDWSLQRESSNDELQKNIKDYKLFGHLEHPPDKCDKTGCRIDHANKKYPYIFVFDNLNYIYANDSIKVRVIYLPTQLGLDYSNRIRQTDGKDMYLSMTSLLRCGGNGNCEVKKITGGDQVKRPAVPTAKLLSWGELNDDEYKLFLDKLSRVREWQENDGSNLRIKLNGKDELQLNSYHDCGCDTEHDCGCGGNNKYLLQEKNNKSAGSLYPASLNRQNRQIINSRQWRDSNMLSLEQILGQAKGYGLTQEAVLSLEFWVEKLDGIEDSMDSQMAMANSLGRDSINQLQSSEKFITQLQQRDAIKSDFALFGSYCVDKNFIGKDSLVSPRKTMEAVRAYVETKNRDGRPRMDNPPAYGQNNYSYAGQPQHGTPNQFAGLDAALKPLQDSLTSGLSRIEQKVDTIEQRVVKIETKDAVITAEDNAKKATKEWQDKFASIFSADKDAFIFGDEKNPVIFQRKSFDSGMVNKLVENGKTFTNYTDACNYAVSMFDSFAAMGANNKLLKAGLNLSDFDSAEQRAKESKIRGIGAGNNAQVNSNGGFAQEWTDKFQAQYDQMLIKNDRNLFNTVKAHRDSEAFQNCTQEVTSLYREDQQVTFNAVNNYVESGKDSVNFIHDPAIGNDPFAQFLKLHPTEDDKIVIGRDSAGQVTNNAANAIILPLFSTFNKVNQVEMLDAIELYSGFNRNAMVATPGNEGFGRVWSFGQEFTGTISGDDPYHEMPRTADTVFDEIGIRTAREEFVARDFGLAFRFSRGDANCLLSAGAPMNLLVRLTFHLQRDMARRRNARMYRELFRRSSQVRQEARTDVVANNAPAGPNTAGLLNYTGDYIAFTAGTAATIGGKTFGGTGSNISGVVRLKGASTAGTSHRNWPVCEAYTQDTYSQKGQITPTDYSPSTLTIAGVSSGAALERGYLYVDANGAQQIGPSTAKWAMDLDGFAVLKDATGHGADPTSPQITVTYYQNMNVSWYNQNPGSDDPSKFFNGYFEKTAEIASGMMQEEGLYAMPDTVLMSHKFGTTISKADIYYKLNSPEGARLLSVFTPEFIFAGYGSMGYVKTNSTLPFRDNRSLILQNGYACCAFLLEQMSELYRAQKANTSTGKIQTLPELVVDFFSQDALGVPILIDPVTDQVWNFPMREIIHWGLLPSTTD